MCIAIIEFYILFIPLLLVKDWGLIIIPGIHAQARGTIYGHTSIYLSQAALFNQVVYFVYRDTNNTALYVVLTKVSPAGYYTTRGFHHLIQNRYLLDPLNY